MRPRNRSNRKRDALGVCIISVSNLLPYRLFRKLRYALLRLAGVTFEGPSFILGPIYISYPSRLRIGERTFINGNCIFENIEQVTIGAGTMIGPACLFLTNNHRVEDQTEMPLPITIGRDVWIGGGVRIVPGARIGDRAVVGAGAVVTGLVEEAQTVVGVPARPIARSSSHPAVQ
jgi:acetyltransferase-like isoleucine patch superfamily enzyme